MAESIKIEQYTELEHRDWLNKAIAEGMEYGQADIPFAKTVILKGGDRPFAVVRVLENAEYFEPHANIFPWATQRQIYEGTLAILKWLRAIKHVLIIVRDTNRYIYDRWTQHGIARRVGTLEQFSFGNAFIYQVNHAVI